MARAIHQGYIGDCKGRGDTEASNPSMVPWPYLPTYLKQSNIAQVEHVRGKLKAIGATLTDTLPATPFAFDAHVEERAQLEHQRWMNERPAAGFEYGEKPEGRFHPDLVEWSKLRDESRQKDRAAVVRLPALLAAEGLYIEPSAEPSDSLGGSTGR